MTRDLRGDLLPEWIDYVRKDRLPALNSLVAGLERDLAAVTARTHPALEQRPHQGHREPPQNGQEKLFGRANFDLPRKLILLT
jgi:hypothetical protein